MAETTFVLDIAIKTPLDTLIAFYNNMQNHLQIHPLIQKIELIQEQTNIQQQLVSEFKIQDKLWWLGFIPYRFYYTAIRTILSPTSLQFEVKTFPNIQIRNIVEFGILDAPTSQLTETVFIQAPALLLNYTKKTAQKAHQVSFDKLKSILEK